MNEATGDLLFFLHAHLPYIRHPEHEFFIEELWFYEAISDVYLPLLDVIDKLPLQRRALTISLSPTLCTMMKDPLLLKRYTRHLDRLLVLGQKECVRSETKGQLKNVVHYHRAFYEKSRTLFVEKYQGDLIGAFRTYLEEGRIELVTSSATHAYLPLLYPGKGAVVAQIKVALNEFEQNFKSRPRGIWLPECGFCPELKQPLINEGIEYFILESHGLLHANPFPRHGVFEPARVGDDLFAFARDSATAREVWDAESGYPGDAVYRDFHRDIGYDLDSAELAPFAHPAGIRHATGYKYYRVTGKTDQKELYIPNEAQLQAQADADDFFSKRVAQMSTVADQLKIKPLIVAPFDAELFGHWWHEGPMWLEAVLKQALAPDSPVRLVSPSTVLDEQTGGLKTLIEPGYSSWGDKGYAEFWLNEKNDWIWRHLHRASRTMEQFAERFLDPDSILERYLNQAGRELLLAQASDWPFLMKAGAAEDYARKRVSMHLENFDSLSRRINHLDLDLEALQRAEEKTPLFQSLSYKNFLVR